MDKFIFINQKYKIFIKDVSGDIKTAHSIRLFNAIMLLVSHKCMALYFNPYVNRTEMSELLGKPYSVLARAASLYTDPFLCLSGMLTAYSLFGKLKKTGRFNIFKEYIGRYIRIMPSLAFLIAFCTFILPLIGSGPQWNLVVSHHSDICKQYWWRNLLFIHNWFG
jgi:peptidoglycan/LPS O-acetylase OafA/YrhL